MCLTPTRIRLSGSGSDPCSDIYAFTSTFTVVNANGYSDTNCNAERDCHTQHTPLQFCRVIVKHFRIDLTRGAKLLLLRELRPRKSRRHLIAHHQLLTIFRMRPIPDFI